MFVLNYPQIFKINGLNSVDQTQLVGQAGKKTRTRILIMLQPKGAGLGLFLICLWRTGRNGKYCPETEMRKLKGNVLMKELSLVNILQRYNYSLPYSSACTVKTIARETPGWLGTAWDGSF